MWGIAKPIFRRENAALDNDKREYDLKEKVKNIVTNAPMETHQQCPRRCQEHELSHAALLENDPNNADLKLVDIEKMKKDIKNKRHAMDQDFSLIKEIVDAIDDDNAIDDKTMIFKFNEKMKEHGVK